MIISHSALEVFNYSESNNTLYSDLDKNFPESATDEKEASNNSSISPMLVRK